VKAQRVAERVWVLRLRPPARFRHLTNVYLLEEDGGVVAFDSGSAEMGAAVGRAAAEHGGLRRVVLSHAHPDHRGGASRLEAPVLCHPDERPDVEGDGGLHYWDFGAVRNPLVRRIAPAAVRRMDGGPLAVAGTVSEGDEVAGFRVLHLPGHAPGLIGLWRESDRLALVSDAVFLFDPFTALGLPGQPRIAPPPVRPDEQAARASVRRLAELDAAALWPGHYGPLTGDLGTRLEEAAGGR
jgi:hydroxyacylglutathione hydrolase